MHKICIIIPCYNEEKRLPVEEFINFYEKAFLYFCFVDDGSKDKTLDVLQDLRKGREDRILIISQESNKGKAEAVRTGILKTIEWSDFEIVGYFDADLATPLWEIEHLATHFTPDVLMVFGSRVKRLGANIVRNPYRFYLGRVFATFSSLILHLPVYDTQCGAKLMKAEFARIVFRDPFITRWLFDIEIFVRLVKEFGQNNIPKLVKEVPLEQWIEMGKSKIKISYLFKVPLELIKIYVYMKKKHT
jgi:glycosyltransferase involved in cell wall biosynthesis